MSIAGGHRAANGGIKLQRRKIKTIPAWPPPAGVIALPHPRHLFRTLRWNEARENGTLDTRKSSAVTAKTLSIQGVGHGPLSEKIRCMSTHR